MLRALPLGRKATATRRLFHQLARPAAVRKALGQHVPKARPALPAPSLPSAFQHQQRQFGGPAARALGLALRRAVLYPLALITGAGVSVEELKKRMPDIEMPEFLSEFGNTVASILSGVRDEAKSVAGSIKSAFEADEGDEDTAPASETRQRMVHADEDAPEEAATGDVARTVAAEIEAAAEQLKNDLDRATKRIDELETEVAHLQREIANSETNAQRELLEEREKLQEEIDKLKAENQELHRAIIVGTKDGQRRPRRAIDMFSDILDMRASLDASFEAHDHLPRVVVVGDQSAGKTSVLEVLVRARIFPRGAGEMMTRSPIQVTLSEGQDHTAQIKGRPRIYNLRNDRDLRELRTDIEKLMVESVAGGDVVSNKTLALDVHGPGLQPMVLVDLPGIIQHHTKGMPSSTKSAILNMCKTHIDNPNSIILCIQDASRDAEGSSVADVVRDADPDGQRTIFVLTKVDLAEQLQLPSRKLKSILEGERFNMQAKAYFAVVTGTSNPEDSIDSIRQAERDYFQQSSFFKDGALSVRKTGTDHLSRAVSHLFWDRVRETVDKEAKDIAQMLKEKEREWRNTFPNQARMSRDDLFGMGRHEVLQALAAFSKSHTAEQWERILADKMWQNVRDRLVDDIYIRSAVRGDAAAFQVYFIVGWQLASPCVLTCVGPGSNTYFSLKFQGRLAALECAGFSFSQTSVENKLDSWVSSELPSVVVGAAEEAVQEEFARAIDIPDTDGIFSALKEQVQMACRSETAWNPQSASRIRSMQEFLLRDDRVKSKQAWADAAKFLSETVKTSLAETMARLNDMRGPSSTWQWLTWTRLSDEQKRAQAAFNELLPYFSSQSRPKSLELPHEDLQAAKHSIKKKTNIDVDDETLQRTYFLLAKKGLLQESLDAANYCRSKFSASADDKSRAPNGLACTDVVFFWRFSNMLSTTVNMLRLEAMDYTTEIESTARETLNEIAASPEEKTRLIKGPRVSLAEEIEVLRQLQTRLDAFVRQMRKEGRIAE